MKSKSRRALTVCAILAISWTLYSCVGPAPAAGYVTCVEVSPCNPTARDSVTVRVGGYYPDGCWHPQPGQCGEVDGTSITVTVRATDFWQPGDYCLMWIVPYCLACDYGTLKPGHYTVTVIEEHDSLRDPLPNTSVVEFDVVVPPAVEATVDLEPNTLNLKSKGRYVTCYIELPEGYSPAEIDVSTVVLKDALKAELSPTAIGDHDIDGVPDRMVRFSRSEFAELLDGTHDSRSGSAGGRGSAGSANHGGELEVRVSGELSDGTSFSGTDVIRVMGSDNAPDGVAALGVSLAPVRGEARISYELPAGGHVCLRIYDVAGRLVRTLVDSPEGIGRHQVKWDRGTDDGRHVGAGIYFIRLEHRGGSTVEKLLVMQ